MKYRVTEHHIVEVSFDIDADDEGDASERYREDGSEVHREIVRREFASVEPVD